jgi:hypothetical protein
MTYIAQPSLGDSTSMLPGMFACREHAARVAAGKGKSFRIDSRPIILPNDPRAPIVQLAILLFYPGIVFNHTFDALFRIEGSMLKTDKGPVQFAFPLDEKCVTQEMIDAAVDFIRSGGLTKIAPNVGHDWSELLLGTSSAAAAGSTFGWIGTAAGAAVGFLKSAFSVFGSQEYDDPDAIKGHHTRLSGAYNKRGIRWHYSTDDRDDRCAVLWFSPASGEYTIVEGAQRLWQKLGKPWPGAQPSPAPARPPPRPVQPLRPPAAAPAVQRFVSRPAKKSNISPGTVAVLAAVAIGVALLATRKQEVS